jgi:hypothetical protein
MKPFLHKKVLQLFLLFMLCATSAAGQSALNSKVNIDVRNKNINAIATEIERQSDIHFYFDPIQFDSASFTISGQQLTIAQVLDNIFANTDFKYAVYQNKYIILTKDEQIYTGFKAYAERKQQQRNTQRDPVQLASNERKLYVIGVPGRANRGKSFILSGYVRDEKTGESIVGASVQTDKPLRRVITDDYGYYTIEVPAGQHVLRIESEGMNDRNVSIAMHDNGKLDVELNGRVTTLKSVVISKEKLNNTRKAQMGAQRIDIKTIKQVPVVLGETDVFKAITTFPGVKTVGEASTGLNVRGGSTDQNLLLYNDATIYNPAHFFGMFSVLNPDVVKDVVIYKSSMPARFGGRLSSVVDISGKEGNKKQLSGNAGFGPLTGRLMLEGPIVKERSSFIAAARSTYAQWLINKLPKEYNKSKASFYDVNLLFTQKINKNNDLYITAYTSSDNFKLNSDTSYDYRNMNFSAKWKHVFSNKMNVVLTSGWDNYSYEVNSERNPVNAYKMTFGIQQAYFKTHFTRYINPAHTVDFGIHGILYKLNPGTYKPASSSSLVAFDKLQSERGLESAAYVNDNWSIGDHTSIETGIRYSMFNAMGPREVNTYAKELPRSDENITGTIRYERGKIMQTYGGPEFRLAFRRSVSENSSIKLSVNTQRQYIHMLSNTAAMTPTDTWKLSDPNIQPQTGIQYSIGYYANLKSNTIEISVETYYKQINRYLDYKSGAILTMNHNIETDVIQTKGKAYGAELLIKKSTGKLNGWISYTWSRILLRQDDATAGELINDGKEYPANYDKPHDVTVITNYRLNHRLSFTLNSTYSTGRPLTLPVGRFYYAGSFRTLYGPRNAHRIPDYFRMDASMNLAGNHKLTQRLHTSWTLGVYNLTARKNPFSVFYVSEEGVINGYKLSVFGRAIPFISFNIQF